MRRGLNNSQPPDSFCRTDGIGVGLIGVLPKVNALRLNYTSKVRSYPFDFANEAANTSGNLYEVQATQWGLLGGIGQGAAVTSEYLMPATINSLIVASGAVTLVAILRSNAQDGTGDSSVLLTKTSGSAEHYPFTDGKIYLSPFSTTRWVNALTPPSTITVPHMIAITVKNGAQEFFYNNVSQTTGVVAAAPSMAQGRFTARGYLYYLAMWNRILGRAEIASLYMNPWQIFQPQKRRVLVNSVAGGGSTIFGSYYYRQVAGMAGTP